MGHHFRISAYNEVAHWSLLNTQKKCPPLTKVRINTYRQNPQFIDGEVLLFQEGTTQGDALAMAMYAIGTLSLIHQLDHQVREVWYADNATAGGRMHHLVL